MQKYMDVAIRQSKVWMQIALDADELYALYICCPSTVIWSWSLQISSKTLPIL